MSDSKPVECLEALLIEQDPLGFSAQDFDEAGYPELARLRESPESRQDFMDEYQVVLEGFFLKTGRIVVLAKFPVPIKPIFNKPCCGSNRYSLLGKIV